jgi:NADPH2:quinone reductase
VKALVVAPGAPGGVALGEAPDPEPGRGRVVVDVRAVSLNRGEVRGLASSGEGTVPGWDLAGEVVAGATDGSGPAVGTRVVGMVGSGAWAERAAVPVTFLAPLPDEVSFAAASTLPVAGLTAQRAIAIGDRGHRLWFAGAPTAGSSSPGRRAGWATSPSSWPGTWAPT